MAAGLKRPGRTLIGLIAAITVCGCDNGQNEADKQVRADLAEARQLARATVENATDASRRKFQDAAQIAAASAGPRAAAKAALAELDMEIANATIRKIDQSELSLARVSWDIAQLAGQIRSNGVAVAGYRQFDPKPARDAIATKILEAQGGPDKPVWYSNGKASLPTLSAVQQELSKIQSELSQRQDQVKSLTQQRGSKLDEAEQATAQSEQLKGQQSVDVFRRASDLRKQAGDLATETDKLNNDVTRLQKDLAIAQAQQAAINDVVAQLQDQARTLDAGWRDIETQGAAQQRLSAQILGAAGEAPGAAGGSIQQKAAELDRLIKEIQKFRADALANLDNAIKSFEQAYSAGNELALELTGLTRDPKNAGRAEVASWQNMIKTIQPMQFRLRQAAAERMLGDLRASDAASLSARISLRDAVQAAVNGTGLSVPVEIIDGDMGQERRTALASADEAYKAASDLYETIVAAPMPNDEALQNAARIAAALNGYSWAQIAKLQGNQDAYGKRLQAAKNNRDEAAGRNAVLPPLPAEFGEVPKPPAAEASTPATQPTP